MGKELVNGAIELSDAFSLHTKLTGDGHDHGRASCNDGWIVDERYGCSDRIDLLVDVLGRMVVRAVEGPELLRARVLDGNEGGPSQQKIGSLFGVQPTCPTQRLRERLLEQLRELVEQGSPIIDELAAVLDQKPQLTGSGVVSFPQPQPITMPQQ